MIERAFFRGKSEIRRQVKTRNGESIFKLVVVPDRPFCVTEEREHFGDNAPSSGRERRTVRKETLLEVPNGHPGGILEGAFRWSPKDLLEKYTTCIFVLLRTKYLELYIVDRYVCMTR